MLDDSPLVKLKDTKGTEVVLHPLQIAAMTQAGQHSLSYTQDHRIFIQLAGVHDDCGFTLYMPLAQAVAEWEDKLKNYKGNIS